MDSEHLGSSSDTGFSNIISNAFVDLQPARSPLSQPCPAARKVAALILHWEDDVAPTGREVGSLSTLLKWSFGYHVTVKRLPNRACQMHFQKIILDFVLANMEQRELLLVYYTGHGYVDGVTGSLKLTASSDIIPSLSIDWSHAEDLLGSAEADVLTILDSCHAAAAFRPPSTRHRFERFAACQNLTRNSGPSSFTSALIQALNELLGAPQKSFSTRELLQRVLTAPTLTSREQPQLLVSASQNRTPIVLGRNYGSVGKGLHSRIFRVLEWLFDNFRNMTLHLLCTFQATLNPFMRRRWAIYKGAVLRQEGLQHRRPYPSPSGMGNTYDHDPGHSLWIRPFQTNEQMQTPTIIQTLSKWKSRASTATFDFVKDKTTVLCITTALLIVSSSFTIRALFTPRPPECSSVPSFDDNFFSSLSQLHINICSLYLVIVPLLRHRGLRLGYRFWYRLCLTLSLLTAGAAPIVYPYSWKVSAVLGLVSGLLQIIGSVQLIECFQDAVETGTIGTMELRLLGGDDIGGEMSRN